MSFVPAAGEGSCGGRKEVDDTFTYHHLRRDLYGLCREADVVVESRYTVPSAHLTIGRFITADDLTRVAEGSGPRVADLEKLRRWVEEIDQINEWLRMEFWPRNRSEPPHAEHEWVVGEGKGLDCRYGTLWYGGGISLRVGQGF